MHFLRFRKIIGIVSIVILLIAQAPSAYALYSPTLNQEVAQIKQNIQKAKKNNGVGTYAQAYDKAEQNNRQPNQELVDLYKNSISTTIIKSLTYSLLDSLSLIAGRWIGTGTWISNCLRDDIWELQSLQEQVLNELLKSALLGDHANASLLWKDYQYLLYRIQGGEMEVDGKTVKITSLKYDYKNGNIWFPESQNFYIECPSQELTQIWDAFKKALDSFRSLGTGTIELGSFGSLAEKAEKRAKIRAQQWIKANQLTLTLGGKEGSNPRSLVSGPGLAGLAADIKTEMDFAKSYGELIFSNTWKSLTYVPESIVGIGKLALHGLGIKDYADSYTKAHDAKQLAIEQMEVAIVLNLSLNNVSEESLKEIDQTLFKINGIIKDAVNTKDAPANLKTLCEKTKMVPTLQCKNKTGGLKISCN